MKYVILFIIPLFFLGTGCFTHSDADQLGKVTIASGEAVILINSFEFLPSTLTIRKGDTIRFLNEGNGEQHKPIFNSDSSLTPSEPIEQLGYWEITLNSRGEWTYFDELNESMKGVVIVK